MDYEYITIVEFYLNGQRCYTELSLDDEDNDFSVLAKFGV